MTITIDLTPEEEARIQAEVNRLVKSGESGLTPAAFVARMTRKLVAGWVAEQGGRLQAAVLAAAERAYQADPAQRAALLEAIGVAIVDGEVVPRSAVQG
jgi:hypothetical protein